MAVQSHTQFASVPDLANDFLALFPHRFDYIWAPYPDLAEPVTWKTESRHPLSDRLIQQAAYLYGVRFGAQTKYFLLDIDAGSPYHPQQDAFAIARIVTALERLGVSRFVACTSSYSGGLHLYFPFAQSQSSWKLAIAVASLLENAGFKIRAGQLEVFPDPKPYGLKDQPSLFNAHRLPLQIGSYLVDADFQPIWTDSTIFVQQWHLAECWNEIKSETIATLLKQIQRHRYFVSTKADKFINDLNAEIEIGWTGPGQTNYLLGRITMREYIFRHILTGGNPLEGEALVETIVTVAQALPGYQDWCRHRHEIRQRAVEWARCIEQSHYFHYGDAAGKFRAKSSDQPVVNPNLEAAIAAPPSWNQQQSATARDRIRVAIASLLDQGTLPATPTARFRALVQAGIGGGTLYRHRDLWHPHYFQLEQVDVISVETSVETTTEPVENSILTQSEWDCCGAASHSDYPPSLFQQLGGNPLSTELSSDQLTGSEASGRNAVPAIAICSPLMALWAESGATPLRTVPSVTAIAPPQPAQQTCQTRQIAKMQQFLDSGDPILWAEAIAWAKAHPGVLKLPPDLPLA